MKRLKDWILTFTPAQRHNILLIKLFVFVVLFMNVVSIDVTIQSKGTIVPEGDVYSLDSMVTGQVNAVNFKQGDRVKKGDVIVSINTGVGYEDYNIIANIDGIVQSLNFKNAGAVVKQGNPVVLLIPEDRECEVEAKLMIRDRGYIVPGQYVKVRLDSTDSFRFTPIDGEVKSISPDAIQSQEGNYYTVRIKIKQQKFVAKEHTYNLVPGVDVITQIVTGNRSIAEYIMSPLLSNLSGAFQEK